LERSLHGEDISDYLTQAEEAGFNLLRVLAMKTDNTGWALDPKQSLYWDALDRLFQRLDTFGFHCELTVFADTRYVLPNPTDQQVFWTRVIDMAKEHSNVLLELVNEYGHPTQAINPLNFHKPDGILASHGSGLTDSDGVQPYWDYMTYHARRDAPPDARGFTNYNQYEFQSVYPSLPRIPDEGIKPENYGYDIGYASLLGMHAACGAGGTFHWGGGVNSEMMDSKTYDCAVAFTKALA
ncbi:MAG TPA: hypothetical protein VM577_19375, partial [Anaerovoracaceae bacterium]|nr:hypothetical protein [Anaerovoracaceae bacterium]